MSKLISGKEAFDAAYNGCEAQWRWIGKDGEWRELEVGTVFSINDLKGGACEFRLKPRTITINGIEVPAPADDKDYHHQGIWILNSLEPKEYGYVVLDITDELPRYWWYTEEEIKQVVSALRSIFKTI